MVISKRDFNDIIDVGRAEMKRKAESAVQAASGCMYGFMRMGIWAMGYNQGINFVQINEAVRAGVITEKEGARITEEFNSIENAASKKVIELLKQKCSCKESRL